MQVGIQFFPDIGPDREVRPRLLAGSAAPGRPGRSLRLQPRPHHRALFQCLWRLQPEPDRVPRRRRAGHAKRAPGHRRGAAGLQPSAEAGRRDRDARRAVRRPARCRLRPRLPAARVRPFRRGAGRKPGAFRRRHGAGAPAAGGRTSPAAGRFHSFRNVTSLPRPTQQPRPPFYVAALASKESFERAGAAGHGIMAIPMAGGAMAELIATYRDAWKQAGHPGTGSVMLAFHMLCHADQTEAERIARDPLERYLRSLVAAASAWMSGTNSADYKGYDQVIAALARETFDTQVAKCAAWVGTPERILDTIADLSASGRRIRNRIVTSQLQRRQSGDRPRRPCGCSENGCCQTLLRSKQKQRSATARHLLILLPGRHVHRRRIICLPPMQQQRDQPGPARLVRGPKTLPGVAMEKFIEQDMIAKMRIVAAATSSSRTPAAGHPGHAETAVSAAPTIHRRSPAGSV